MKPGQKEFSLGAPRGRYRVALNKSAFFGFEDTPAGDGDAIEVEDSNPTLFFHLPQNAGSFIDISLINLMFVQICLWIEIGVFTLDPLIV